MVVLAALLLQEVDGAGDEPRVDVARTVSHIYLALGKFPKLPPTPFKASFTPHGNNSSFHGRKSNSQGTWGEVSMEVNLTSIEACTTLECPSMEASTNFDGIFIHGELGNHQLPWKFARPGFSAMKASS